MVTGFFSIVECVNQKLWAACILRCLDLDVDIEGTRNDAYQPGPKNMPKTKNFFKLRRSCGSRQDEFVIALEVFWSFLVFSEAGVFFGSMSPFCLFPFLFTSKLCSPVKHHS